MEELTLMPSETSFKAPFLEGGGELGELIRKFDWSSTPLGPPESWPQSLRTCVRIMLASRQPIWIGWGKELIKLYNDPYKTIVGGKHPWALGKPASVVWNDIWDDIAPMLRTVMEKDEGTYVESQLLIMERNGYHEETYYTFSYTPIPGDKGGTAGMICANTDDTEGIIGERQLRTLRDLGNSLAKMQTVTEVYQNALKVLENNQKDFPFAVLYKIDDAGRTAKPIAFASIDEGQTVFPSFIDLEHPKNGTLNFCRAFNNKEIVLSENKGRRKNLPTGAWEVEATHFIHIPIITFGSNYPNAILSAPLNPFRKFDGPYKQFILLVADQIALEVNNIMAYEQERKRAEALAEIDKAKTVFFSNISHEFRTPLTLMLGPLEEMLNGDKELLSDEEKTKLETTHRNAMRLLRLVNNLLDFSRIEAGKTRAQFQETDIAGFTNELAGNFRSVMEQAGLRLKVRFPELKQQVYIDRNMWEKIVMNLLSNAFKYTLKGTIEISLSETGESVTLKVSDTGVGIPEQELPKMFQRFHRVENVTGRSFEGSGIGLSLVSELVKLHGGTITVSSKVDKGSTFTITLPAGKDHLPNDQVANATTDFQRGQADAYIDEAKRFADRQGLEKTTKEHLESANLLIVDDNGDMRDYLTGILNKSFNITVAANGIEAIAKIRKNVPQLVICDVMMPGMDGVEFLKTLRTNQGWKTIPVILLSARAGEEAKIEGYEIGADDYIVKPFSAKELLARVRSQLHIASVRKQEENKLIEFFGQAPAAIAVLHGPQLMFTIANSLYQKIVGRTAEELIGKTVREIWPEFEGQGVHELLANVFRTGEPYTAHEFPASFKNHGILKTRYFDFVAHPIRNNNGEVTDIMIHANDVTDQVNSRKEHADSERKFKTAIDQSPTAIAIIKVPEFNIELINEKWLRRMGAKIEQLVGRPLFEMFPMLVERGLDKILQTKVLDGDAHYESEYAVDFVRFGQSGTAYFDVVYQPLSDVNGVVNRIMIISHEITELVEARKKIEESESYFRKMADDAPIMIWMTGADSLSNFFNKNWLQFRGRSIDEEKGDGWKDGVHPDDLDRYIANYEASFKERKSFHLDFRLKRHDGVYRWISNIGAPTYDPSGSFSGYIGSCADIHEMKVLENRKDDFIRMASHELKTPVTSIKGYVQLLLTAMKNEDGNQTVPPLLVKSSLVSIDKQVSRLTRLMSELLDLSKIETGQLQLNKEKFNLNELVIDTVQDILYTNSKHSINVFHDFGCDVYADKDRLGQVLINFLTNAVKYSPNSDKVEVWIRKSGKDSVSVSVKDFGIGVDKEFHEKIFERFYRAEGKEEQTYPGFGIGLFIAKEIIQRHSGSISLTSEKGKGSVFTFTLPVAT